MFNKIALHCSVVIVLWVPGMSTAGTVAGFGGGTEITQLMNNTQLVLQYEQQVQAYVRQGLQLQNELKNLIQNPASVMGVEVGGLINNVGKIMSGGLAIGSNLAQIDKNFATTFKSPTADTLSKNFFKWHKTSTDTLEGALKAAGLHREHYASEADALAALYNQSQATSGNLDALQTLSQINIKQIQHLQSLGDLMATQNLASSTYMAAQTAKGQASIENDDAVQKGFSETKPAAPTTLNTSSRTYKKWDLYSPK